MENATITELDFHDARLSSIEILAGGVVQIEFGHICSYHEDSAGKSEVWSSSATLLLSGAQSISINGIIMDDDYVTEGSLVDERRNEVPLVPVGVQKNAKCLDLLLAGSGTRIQVSMEAVLLKTFSPIKKLEDWDG